MTQSARPTRSSASSRSWVGNSAQSASATSIPLTIRLATTSIKPHRRGKSHHHDPRSSSGAPPERAARCQPPGLHDLQGHIVISLTEADPRRRRHRRLRVPCDGNGERADVRRGRAGGEGPLRDGSPPDSPGAGACRSSGLFDAGSEVISDPVRLVEGRRYAITDVEHHGQRTAVGTFDEIRASIWKGEGRKDHVHLMGGEDRRRAQGQCQSTRAWSAPAVAPKAATGWPVRPTR
jgi:hypothetical protein